MSIEAIPWQDFQKQLRWRQGEHVAAIAPTGAGKTTLMQALLPYRKYSIFLGTKPDDPLYRSIQKKGFRRVESVAEIKPWDDKILLWPKQRKTIADTFTIQKRVFLDVFDMVVNQRAWTLWVDECKYMAEQLGLSRSLTYCLEQLRSINGTTVNGAQRPVWLPKSVLANSSHVFLWKTTDRDDLKRLADIGGLDAKLVGKEAQSLGRHEFIYVHTRGTEVKMIRSQVER